jgi:small subunit ribosomal protein S18
MRDFKRKGRYEGKAKKMPKDKLFFKKKYCRFCADKIDLIDYKDVIRLKKFTTEKGKILPSRITGNCATHQRRIAEAIKMARFMALLPYVGE